MERTIELKDIRTEGNRIYYSLCDESEMGLLKKKNVEAYIQFDHCEQFGLNLAGIPKSVLAIPMSLYLIPITYFYDVELRLPVMDRELHESLPEIYGAYDRIYGPFDGYVGGGISGCH